MREMRGQVPEFIGLRFRENKPKTLVFSYRKRAFWACFRENCVYNFGQGTRMMDSYVRIGIRPGTGIKEYFYTVNMDM